MKKNKKKKLVTLEYAVYKRLMKEDNASYIINLLLKHWYKL